MRAQNRTSSGTFIGCSGGGTSGRDGRGAHGPVAERAGAVVVLHVQTDT
ncbi:hypothetical protein Ae168Ps1_4431 [Pseudonocardia sp. Ae168_Ps1]|nr:hypothetical protein Ae168Ps1_4431 [Pseudonocardia sp. Ae168_Ps1]